MKTRLKFVALMITISILSSFSLSVYAADPDNTVYTHVMVSAGNTYYTTNSVEKTGLVNQCYIRLRWFQFQYYPENSMPGGKRIYARMCTPSGTFASNDASFTGPTSQGQYNFSYKNGYGGSGQNYKMSTNSDYTLTYYWVRIDWNSNPYVYA